MSKNVTSTVRGFHLVASAGLVGTVFDMNTTRNSQDLLNIADLAIRWNVSRDTARNYTKRRGFPQRLGLPKVSHRWLRVEIEEYEKDHSVKRRIRNTRVAPYRGQLLPLPSRIISAQGRVSL